MSPTDRSESLDGIRPPMMPVDTAPAALEKMIDSAGSPEERRDAERSLKVVRRHQQQARQSN